LVGPFAFVTCFDLHSRLRGNTPLVSAQTAVDICRLAYSQNAWDRDWFDLSGERPTSGHDLFGWYLYQQGAESRLEFDANEPLTRELIKSVSVHWQRTNAYLFGDTGPGIAEYRYNLPQQIACMVDFRNVTKLSMPLTCVLGSYYYQIKTVRNQNGDWLGFRIDNRTDLESGTHIAFRFPGGLYEGSIEELIANGEIQGSESLLTVANRSYNGKRVVSILRARDRDVTVPWESAWGTTYQLGGGNLVQTYYWLEERNPCPFPSILFQSSFLDDLEIAPWDDVADHTDPISLWGETW